MLYLGGKTRSGREIAKCILSLTPHRTHYLEPFFGGGSSCIHLAPQFEDVRVGDVHTDLILMWQAVQEGWRAPLHVTNEEYNQLKYKEPSALRGFAGFACSFGGKWFGGYARDGTDESLYSYAKPQAYRIDEIGSILRLSKAMILNVSYEQWTHKKGVVYCDPPYAGTTRYAGGFDSARFWKTMDKWTEEGATVFVSEYKAPSHWEQVWESTIFCKVSNRGARTERLFWRKK